MTLRQVLEIMDKWNNRPRKSLGYKTPNQVFFGINPPVASGSQLQNYPTWRPSLFIHCF